MKKKLAVGISSEHLRTARALNECLRRLVLRNAPYPCNLHWPLAAAVSGLVFHPYVKTLFSRKHSFPCIVPQLSRHPLSSWPSQSLSFLVLLNRVTGLRVWRYLLVFSFIFYLISLEPWPTYHKRYVALGCASQRNTAFFDSCCHPLLVGLLLSYNQTIIVEPSN